jgi:hypothetical protein
MEYLLSLPYSRLKLVGLKTLPRSIAVLFFYLVFLILYLRGGINAMALSFISFTVIYFLLFLIALSLSASSENFIVLSITSLLSLCAYLALIYLIFWTAIKAKGFIYYELKIRPFFVEQEIESIFIKLLIPVAIGILLPLLLSFILSFKKFDMRPSRIYNKRFFKFFAPLLILGLISSFIFAYQGIDLGYSSYYLTQDYKLIEYNDYSNIKIFDNDKVYKIKGQFDFYFYGPSLEDNEYVYATSYQDKIIRLSTSKLKMEVFYEAPRGSWLGSWGIYKYEQTIAFIERIERKKNRYAETQLVLIDEPSRKITRIPLAREPLINYTSPIIFGADRMDDKTFWLLCDFRTKEHPIVKIWEDGKVEVMGESEKWPCYVNRMLITSTGKEIIINKEKAGKFEPIRKILNIEGFIFWREGYREILDNIPLKEIYGRKIIPSSDQKGKRQYTTKYVRLNLENLELEEIKDFEGHLLYFYPADYYAFDLDEATPKARFYELKEGKLNFIKELTNFDLKSYENLGIFKAGVVLKKGRKVRVYAFPDLKELKFKKL